jgi:hypothetical protein
MVYRPDHADTAFTVPLFDQYEANDANRASMTIPIGLLI